MFIGSSGAGKSTTINAIQESIMILNPDGTISAEATKTVNDIAPIGHGNDSET